MLGKKNVLLGVYLFLIGTLFSQNSRPTFTASQRKVCSLPSPIMESSGLALTKNGTFWTHGDGKNPAQLYEFDSSGFLLRTLNLSNGTNIDWEDLSIDQQGNLFLSDAGNNDCDRTDLKIYIIMDPSKHDSTAVHAESINFTFEDQMVIPSAIGNRNFDIEGLAVYKDSLLLFTKNRSSPSSGYTKVYRLPKYAGNFKALLVDSIFVQTHIQLGRITGADFDQDLGLLVLQTLQQLLVFRSKNEHIQWDTFNYYRLPYHTNQFEAIEWKDAWHLWATDEVPGNLYEFTLVDKPFLYPLKSETVFPNSQVQIYRDAAGIIQIHIPTGASIQIFDVSGRLCDDFQDLSTGIYTVLISFSDGSSHAKKFIL